jgi:hypothetical protein
MQLSLLHKNTQNLITKQHHTTDLKASIEQGVIDPRIQYTDTK